MLDSKNKTGYVSDTRNYIGYNYIKNCSDRYKKKYQNLPDNDIFYKMCNIMQIDPLLVQKNQQNTGGAQYLLKNIDYNFWLDCEDKCNKLYKFFLDYTKKFPINHHIQKWTVDMWVVLWNYWKLGRKTEIHKDLHFSWGTGSVKEYHERPIFHLAGVTKQNNKDKFHKAKYNNKLVFTSYINNPNIFDHINKNNATYEYIKILKEYTNNIYKNNNNLNLNNNINNNINNNNNINDNVTKFRIIVSSIWRGIYEEDKDKKICGKNIWRSENNKFIMYWNNISWVVTFKKYENEVGNKSGGLASNYSDEPYKSNWNVNVVIDLL
jgi:hypothetical protein